MGACSVDAEARSLYDILPMDGQVDILSSGRTGHQDEYVGNLLKHVFTLSCEFLEFYHHCIPWVAPCLFQQL